MNRTASHNPSGHAARCPSCDRYIGPVGRCPYCGADVVRPGAQRTLRLAALVLAGAGLCCLYLVARYREPTVVEIEAITPRMNYATVRVAGTVASKPYLVRRNGHLDYLSFVVGDGTGELRVSADGRTARALLREDLIPKRGEEVEVTGRITARADGQRRLSLQAAAGLDPMNREE